MYLAEYDGKFPFRGGSRKNKILWIDTVFASLSFVFRPKIKRMA